MRVKNWDRFQHFKDRKPLWIKLYREILDQRDIALLSDCAFRVLVGCWLLASEDESHQGNIPEVDDLAFRLRIEKAKVIKALGELEPFLYQADIKLSSSCHHLDNLEKEKEKEKESTLSGKPDCKNVLEHLNRKAGRGYKPTTVNLDLIKARLKEGHTIEDCYKVIDSKVEEWGTNGEMCKFLRPATLFNRTKFNQYVGELNTLVPGEAVGGNVL